MDSDGVSQEWFDEDFGLTRRKQEAEELHRQQLLIEQEVCALLLLFTLAFQFPYKIMII